MLSDMHSISGKVRWGLPWWGLLYRGVHVF